VPGRPFMASGSPVAAFSRQRLVVLLHHLLVAVRYFFVTDLQQPSIVARRQAASQAVFEFLQTLNDVSFQHGDTLRAGQAASRTQSS